jgi:hypothetical protein
MSETTNLHLRFFDKGGRPLNFEYVGPTGPNQEIGALSYFVTANTASSPGQINLSTLGSGSFTINQIDRNDYSILSWAQTLISWLNFGTDVEMSLEIQGGQNIIIYVDTITIGGSDITVNFTRFSGNLIVSSGKNVTVRTSYEKAPGGHYRGAIYFDTVSAGLFENAQIFIVQEFKDGGGNSIFGYPHAGIAGTSEPVQWRTRWQNKTYGNVDVSDIIFTYQITDNDPEIGGDPSISNFPNITFPIPVESTDTLVDGYTVTSFNLEAPITINVAINSVNAAAEVYERKLIVEQIIGLTGASPTKVLEIDFYGEIEGEDERLEVLLQNLGRSLTPDENLVFRDHDPSEPLPDYRELNVKRKELLVAGEDIFPYIGSYKGLINALRFFGYQDLRIKEYWLNIDFRTNTSVGNAVQENQKYLDSLKKIPYSNSFLIDEIINDPNSGKFRMVQTYGPDSDGNYRLDVSGEDTLVPSGTFKKTALFGLYYDINKVTNELNEFGYPVVDDAFMFSQEEVLIKLFSLKEILKRKYLPVNARIVDITGEGIYFNVYNTKSWSDIMDRIEINLGNEVDFFVNPDFGYLEDLRNFGIRNSASSIQIPMNYGATGSFTVSLAGTTGGTSAGGALVFSGISGNNPQLEITKGKSYSFTNQTGFGFYLTTDPLLIQNDPLGVSRNGATGGQISIDVNPQEQSQIYYYLDANPTVLSGSISVADASVSDLGNTILPLAFAQQYTADQNSSMITAISNFYELKQNGMLQEFPDSKWDPEQYIDPSTGLPWKNPVGMPLILEYDLDRWDWNEMDVNWDSLYSPYSIGVTGSAPPNSNSILTWDNINFGNYNEIEWIVTKNPNSPGSPYRFSYRGYISDFYRLAHFVPYTGIYDVQCNIYDSNNSILRKIEKQILQVSPKLIDLKGWTRYRENEFYTWDQTIRDWDSYDSEWIYPAEGLDRSNLLKEIPSDLLDFAFYGNNASEGEEIEVNINSGGRGATGSFSISQNSIPVVSISAPRISGTQFGLAIVTTSTPHGLSDNDFIFLENSTEFLTGKWQVIITDDLADNQFKLPIVLSPQAGILVTLSQISVDTSLFPNMEIVEEGSISVSVNGRVIGATAGGSTLQSCVNSIVTEINNFITDPDFFATSLDPSANPASITISSPSNSGAIYNGIPLSVTTSGAIQLVSSDGFLSGGVNPSNEYVSWDESQSEYPNANLKYWGTQNLVWNTFNEVSWDAGYAHSWWDFEYDNTWLGGFEIHSSLVGESISVNTGKKILPFSSGITFFGTGATGASGYLTLKEVADQMNESGDPHITNFYYRAFPSEFENSLTITGPSKRSTINVSSPGGSFPAPPSVLGANPVLCVDFTYATGP